MKNLRFLIPVLILLVSSFGSNAQTGNDKRVATKMPCMLSVRCTKLDSIQHDLEMIPFLKEEIESWKGLVNTQKVMIADKAETILALSDTLTVHREKLQVANVKITVLEDKVARRGRQRFKWSAGSLLAGRILGFFF